MTGHLRLAHSVPTAAEIALAAWEGRQLPDAEGRPVSVWLFDVVDAELGRSLFREADRLLQQTRACAT